MKKLLPIILMFCLSATALYAGQIEIRGTYQGENLYVKNPFAAAGVGFCVYEVSVNGMTTTDEINSAAFEIDLAVYGFNLGDPIRIAINYKDGCLPRVLNPDVLNARASFEIVSLRIQGDKVLWTTKNEAGTLPFVVEQFRWNKWVAVGRVEGKGQPGENNYAAPVRLHAGENRFRLRQTDARRKSKYSAELLINSSRAPLTFSVVSTDNEVVFSEATMYELYDSHGRIVLKGFGDRLSIDSLDRGWYYLNFDNQMEMFRK